MKPFTSKHCIQYLTKESPFSQRSNQESLPSTHNRPLPPKVMELKEVPPPMNLPKLVVPKLAPKTIARTAGELAKEGIREAGEELRANINDPAQQKLKEQYRKKTVPTGIAPDERTFNPNIEEKLKGGEPKTTPLNQDKKIIGEQTYELNPDKVSGNYVAGLSLDGGSAEPEFTKNRLVITPSQYNSLTSRGKISSGFVGGDYIEQDYPMNIKKDSVSGGKNYYSIKSNRESFKKR